MFNLVSKFTPSEDQPLTIEKLVDGINNGKREVGQLYSEFKELFTDNAVEYFVS